jgi:hypothetical protein
MIFFESLLLINFFITQYCQCVNANSIDSYNDKWCCDIREYCAFEHGHSNDVVK